MGKRSPCHLMWQRRRHAQNATIFAQRQHRSAAASRRAERMRGGQGTEDLGEDVCLMDGVGAAEAGDLREGQEGLQLKAPAHAQHAVLLPGPEALEDGLDASA